MSKSGFAVLTACIALGFTCLFATSTMATSVNFYTIGARYHTTHTHFDALPFRNGDLTYQAGVEFHEGIGFWQIIGGYTPSIKTVADFEGPEIDYVFTPQLNLILQDQGWLAGTGVLASYIKDETESDWTKLYWQALIGYQFRLQHFTLDIMAIYSFDRWSNISDFQFGDLEFSGMLKRRF